MFGFPFFYWFQFALIVAAAAVLTLTAHAVSARDTNVYIALVAFLADLLVAMVLTVVLRAMKVDPAPTRPTPTTTSPTWATRVSRRTWTRTSRPTPDPVRRSDDAYPPEVSGGSVPSGAG